MTAPCENRKRREVVFKPLPPGQIERAQGWLASLSGLRVRRTGDCILCLEYDLIDYTLEALEEDLVRRGYHLEATVLIRIRRALIYHCERNQRSSMEEPSPSTKNYKAFVEAWQHSLHGDHDETPEEWRQYK